MGKNRNAEQAFVGFANEELTEENFALVIVNLIRQLRGFPLTNRPDPTYCAEHNLTLDSLGVLQKNITHVLYFYGRVPDEDQRILHTLNSHVKRCRAKLEENPDGQLRKVLWAENPIDEINSNLADVIINGPPDVVECEYCWKFLLKKTANQRFCSNQSWCRRQYHNQRPLRKWWGDLSGPERDEYLKTKRALWDCLSQEEQDEIMARAMAQPHEPVWEGMALYILKQVVSYQ
ncbi:hypothetical protein MYX64_07315 [Nitrospinae bacterium AH_259_B05_G02_I21]|nr:hypothetical protein [Nitrospinae bacterium AH_259_B05_G02_I21]MDA2931838.1 hypothetical protein [Nitrospinae bacterium AH-259-F20]